MNNRRPARAESTSMMNKQSGPEKVIVAILTVLVVLFFMLPIFWLVTTSFKFGREALAMQNKWLFFDFTSRNYQ